MQIFTLVLLLIFDKAKSFLFIIYLQSSSGCKTATVSEILIVSSLHLFAKEWKNCNFYF